MPSASVTALAPFLLVPAMFSRSSKMPVGPTRNTLLCICSLINYHTRQHFSCLRWLHCGCLQSKPHTTQLTTKPQNHSAKVIWLYEFVYTLHFLCGIGLNIFHFNRNRFRYSKKMPPSAFAKLGLSILGTDVLFLCTMIPGIHGS